MHYTFDQFAVRRHSDVALRLVFLSQHKGVWMKCVPLVLFWPCKSLNSFWIKGAGGKASGEAGCQTSCCTSPQRPFISATSIRLAAELTRLFDWSWREFDVLTGEAKCNALRRTHLSPSEQQSLTKYIQVLFLGKSSRQMVFLNGKDLLEESIITCCCKNI